MGTNCNFHRVYHIVGLCRIQVKNVQVSSCVPSLPINEVTKPTVLKHHEAKFVLRGKECHDWSSIAAMSKRETLDDDVLCFCHEILRFTLMPDAMEVTESLGRIPGTKSSEFPT